MKNFSKEIPLHTIERECMCSPEAAESVRRELYSLIATLDVAACFYECELHYVSVQKPVCRLCENGKMLYKMTDFVNTVIDRHLQNPDYCNQLSESEIELFRKDMMTFALENAVSSSSNPITVCANEDCYFSVDSDGNADVLYDFDTTNNKDLPVEIDMNRFTDTDTVHIDSDNVYSDTLSGWNNARAIMGIKLPVQYVANVGANCWAACFGCLSTYYTNTNTGGSVQDGEDMRNIAMNTYSSGGKTQVKELLSKYNNVSMTIVNNILSWDTIKTEISTRSPFYTSWVRTGGRHALVVSGYTYNNVTNGDKKIYAMDPNVGTNVSISYGSTCTYSPSTSRTYTWESTLYRA